MLAVSASRTAHILLAAGSWLPGGCGPSSSAATSGTGTSGDFATSSGEGGGTTNVRGDSSGRVEPASSDGDGTGGAPACGNGLLDPGEDCDDGNRFDHDDCPWDCIEDDGHRIATGTFTTCAAWPGGLRCWGYNGLGAIGNGEVGPACFYTPSDFGCELAPYCCAGDDELPSALPRASTAADIDAVAVSARHTCIARSGSLECWGATFMQGVPPDPRCASGPLLECFSPGCCLGDDEAVGQNAQPLADVRQVAAGSLHVCALTGSGEVYCWGSARQGNLGTGVPDGEIIGDDEPIDARGPVSLGGEAIFITAERDASCAILADGKVRCWGACGVESECLDGTPSEPIGDDEVPEDQPPLALPAPAIDVDLGALHACAVLDDGAVHCWGRDGVEDAMGYLGLDEVAAADSQPVVLASPAVKVSAGAGSTCALLDDGTLRCWGHPAAAGYAVSGVESSYPPSEAPPLPVGGPVADLDDAGNHRCALLQDGQVLCWGKDLGFGQLGYGMDITVGDDETPIDIGPVDYK